MKNKMLKAVGLFPPPYFFIKTVDKVVTICYHLDTILERKLKTMSIILALPLILIVASIIAAACNGSFD